MNITVTTIKYAAAVVCVAGAAAGLNLGVLQLTDTPAQDAVQQVELTGSEPAAPESVQVVVDVPVVVPDGVLAAQNADADAAVTTALAAPEPIAAASGASPLSSPSAAVAGASNANSPQVDATTSSTTTSSTTTSTTSTTTAAPSTTKARTGSTVQSPATTNAPTSTKAPTSTSAPAVTEYLYYDFPGVASQIVIAQHPDGSLEFWSVAPEAGWRYAVEADSSREIEIEFERGDDEAEFKIEMEDGRLKVSKDLDND